MVASLMSPGELRRKRVDLCANRLGRGACISTLGKAQMLSDGHPRYRGFNE